MSTDPTGLLDRAWALDPGVAVRPEPFGALLYHFGTRRLSFLRSLELVSVVTGLADAPDARTACARAGVPEDRLEVTARALARLASSELIRTRS